ncbi:MAG TPA: LCP family protein [Candidatus Limnocylindrales bacterium]|nr:LCP family protein [Candidatus Limnocylindrales bacterium]
MSNLRATWQAMRPMARALAIGGIVVAVVAVAGLGFAVTRSPSGDQQEVLTADESPDGAETPMVLASGETAPPLAPEPTLAPSLDPIPSPTPAGPDELLGSDGRLTVLLLGSDFRPAHPGNRTDAIMVVSVDPASGRTAAFSIPRDYENFPLPNGKKYGAKINSLYQHLLSTTKNGNAAMKRVIADAFDIEIDGLVLIGFDGVRRMIREIGGVTVNLENSYYDSHYWVNNHTQGWGLSAGKHHLNAENALIFARSRKGDSDYGRARRQQQLVMAAVSKVKAKGLTILPDLLQIAKETIRTDLPRARAAEIFDIVSRANLAKAKRVVFSPTKYTNTLGTWRYELDLPAAKRWVASNFPPVTDGATWPPAGSPAP